MNHNDRNLKANLAASYNELVSSFTALSCETIGNYTLGKVIGKGSYGQAYQATHKFLGSKVVLKSTPKSEAPNLAREIHHHRQLHHPHIVQLYEVVITENKVWLVLELCTQGELYDYLIANQRLDEAETQRIFAQICSAVSYIHGKGIVHRDLKLENVFLDRKHNAKLGDFGFTRENDRALLKTWCGSLSYCAPEVVCGDHYQGEAVDVWSLGIILFALLSGHLPYDDDDESVTKRMIIQDKQTYPEHFGASVISLLDSMLSKDPVSRPTVTEVLDHPFLSSQRIIRESPQDQPYVPTFQTRMERTVLERLGVAGIETERVMSHVLDYRCDSLCGWWWLSLQRERRRERRHRNHVRRKSTEQTLDASVVDARAESRRRSRSRQGSHDLRHATGYHFPTLTQNSENASSNHESPLTSTPHLHEVEEKTQPELQHIVDSNSNRRPGMPNAAQPARRHYSEPHTPSRTQGALNNNTLVKTMTESAERKKDIQSRKTGIMQTFKHWWAEQTKSSKIQSPQSSLASPVSTRKSSPPAIVEQVPETSRPASPEIERPSLMPQRPSYRRRRSSQLSASSRGSVVLRSNLLRSRNPTLNIVLPSPTIKQYPPTSPSAGQLTPSSTNGDRPYPLMQRTMSASSNHSSVASYRGSGQASHSKASSTSSNSTFASTRSLRVPRNPLKVMPSTPPPFMIAHQGGYKERNVFESSLAGGHMPLAFASRKKAKRGVLLQQTKQKSRRRISLNEVDLIEEEEEDAEGEEEFVDVEEEELETPLRMLDLVEEGEDDKFELHRPLSTTTTVRSEAMGME